MNQRSKTLSFPAPLRGDLLRQYAAQQSLCFQIIHALAQREGVHQLARIPPMQARFPGLRQKFIRLFKAQFHDKTQFQQIFPGRRLISSAQPIPHLFFHGGADALRVIRAKSLYQRLFRVHALRMAAQYVRKCANLNRMHQQIRRLLRRHIWNDRCLKCPAGYLRHIANETALQLGFPPRDPNSLQSMEILPCPVSSERDFNPVKSLISCQGSPQTDLRGKNHSGHCYQLLNSYHMAHFEKITNIY